MKLDNHMSKNYMEDVFIDLGLNDKDGKPDGTDIFSADLLVEAWADLFTDVEENAMRTGIYPANTPLAGDRIPFVHDYIAHMVASRLVPLYFRSVEGVYNLSDDVILENEMKGMML